MLKGTSKLATLGFITGLIIAGTIAASAATVDLYDGTFNNLTVVQSRGCSPSPCTPPVGFGPSQATITTGVTTPNADSIQADNYAIRASFNWSAPSMNSAGVGILDNATLYTPSAGGAITSLNVSLNKMLTVNTTTNVGRVLLEQDGNYYVHTINNGSALTTGGQYKNYSATGLTASDFAHICLVGCGMGGYLNPLPGTPDFSATGDTLVFGVLFTSNYSPTAYSSFYDNLHFTLTTAPNTTPLPGALPLFASGLSAIGAIHWRRKRKNAAARAA